MQIGKTPTGGAEIVVVFGRAEVEDVLDDRDVPGPMKPDVSVEAGSGTGEAPDLGPG